MLLVLPSFLGPLTFDLPHAPVVEAILAAAAPTVVLAALGGLLLAGGLGSTGVWSHGLLVACAVAARLLCRRRGRTRCDRCGDPMANTGAAFAR